MVVDSPWSVRQAFVQAPFHCEYSTDFGADSRKGALYLAPVEIPMWFTVLGNLGVYNIILEKLS